MAQGAADKGATQRSQFMGAWPDLGKGDGGKMASEKCYDPKMRSSLCPHHLSRAVPD